MKRFNPEDVGTSIAKLLLLEQGHTSKEEKRQDKIATQIDKLKLRAPEGSNEEQITDEEDEDGLESKAKPKPDVESNEKEDDGDGAESSGGKGEDFEVSAPSHIPTMLNIKDIERQLNNLRAGKSLKDKVISQELENYFAELGQGEQQALFTYLASLAAIMTGGSSGSAAPRPQNMDVDIEIDAQAGTEGSQRIRKNKQRSAKEKGTAKKIDLDRSAPIVVGEIANKYRELNSVFENSSYGDSHQCADGKSVLFGSEECVDDLGYRIDDLTNLRNSLSTGSADRASLNGTLKYLRQKKRKAGKLKLAEADDENEETQEKLQSRLNLADEA